MLPTFVKLQDGTIVINEAKRYVRPHWLLTDTNDVIVAPGATSPPQIMTIDTQGHFEAFYAMANRTNPVTVQFMDPGTRRFLQNREIHIDTIIAGGGGGAGSGISAGFAAGRPFIWPESYFFNVEDAGRALQVVYRDISGAGSTVRLSLHGRRFYTKEAPPVIYDKMYKYFGRRERTGVYFLTTDSTVTIPASSTLTAFARVTDEADFEIHKLTAVSTGEFTFTLRDTGTGRILNNFGQVHSSLGLGSAEFPFIFVEPWLVERNYSIQIDFTNLTAAPNEVFLTFTGRRIYYAQ